ncbi:MAG: hypothetical protein GY765_07515 [bacterium]|nr:hypothetical protein [bacterium]
MKKTYLLFLLAICLVMTTLPAKAGELKASFPQLEGWKQKAAPAVYNPDNLYEYINGAADIFLSYHFRELASVTFENEQKKSFTVDVYKHKDSKNGFGIYSQEKPSKGDFLKIGSQGYYEKGTLNFFKGKYYIKIFGYALGDKDHEILTNAAAKTAAKLEGKNRLPATLECFPQQGKVAGSERYIAKDFLGHAFLHSAYVANYMDKDKKIQVFIIEGNDEKEPAKIVEDYMAFLIAKKAAVKKEKEFYTFKDPYYRSGPMHMKRKGKYLWGLFSPNPTFAADIIAGIEAELTKPKK